MAEKVSVTVDENGDPQARDLDVGKSSGNVNIKWSMDTDGWEITDIEKLPSDEFFDKEKDGKTGYKITDKNDNTQTYSYTITIKNLTTRQILKHDPTIRNGGRG
jgi:hypothetical protein